MKAPLAFAAAMTLLSAAHPPAQAQPVRSQDPPAGSYLRSCRDIDVRGGGRDGVLIADCRDSYDRWRTSTLRYGDCRDDIANVGGVLTCRDGGYGGGYGGGGRPGDGWDGAGRGGSVTLFTGPNFQGPSFSSSREFTNLPRQDNDKALSLRVERGAWEVCSDANFGGRCQVFTRDVPDLRAYGLGEAISSLRPARGGDLGGDSWRPPQDNWGGRGGSVTLFYGPDFRGSSFTASQEVSNLRRQDNDKAYSLRIERGAWEVCTDSDFGGRCQVFSRDVRDLRAHGLGGAISSVRPVR